MKAVLFNLYGTIIRPSKGLLLAQTQAFINTIKCDKTILMKSVIKHSGIDVMTQMSNVMSDIYDDRLNLNKLYVKFIKEHYKLINDPEYTQINENIFNIIDRLKRQNITHFGITSPFDKEITNIILNSAKNQGLEIPYIIKSNNIYSFLKENKICKRNCIHIGNTYNDVIESVNTGIINCSITTEIQNNDFMIQYYKPDMTVDNIYLIPEIVKKVNYLKQICGYSKYN